VVSILNSFQRISTWMENIVAIRFDSVLILCYVGKIKFLVMRPAYVNELEDAMRHDIIKHEEKS
jgi:hypothetical protein